MRSSPTQINEFKRKNDYTCKAWIGSTMVNHMEYVHKISVYARWLDMKHIDWRVINVYSAGPGDTYVVIIRGMLFLTGYHDCHTAEWFTARKNSTVTILIILKINVILVHSLQNSLRRQLYP